MKKLYMLFVIFLLAFSVIVMADRGADDNTQTGLRENERIQNTKTIAEKRIVKRKIINIREARQKVVMARERYQIVRENYNNKKQELSRLKTKYQECLNSDTDECKQNVKQTRLKAKDHLMNSAELISGKLEELKTKIQSSNDLTEEEVNEIIENLNEKITEVKEAKVTLENINEDSTSEEIKEATERIRNAWKKTKLHVHKSRMRHVGAMLSNLINKAEILGERAQVRVSELNDGELNTLMEDYNSKVQNAKENHQLAKEKWQTATTPGCIFAPSRY